MSELPKSWKTATLSLLFEESDYKRLEEILLMPESDKKWNVLKIFLNGKEIKKKLRKRGVLSDFLYYSIQTQFRGKQ